MGTFYTFITEPIYCRKDEDKLRQQIEDFLNNTRVKWSKPRSKGVLFYYGHFKNWDVGLADELKGLEEIINYVIISEDGFVGCNSYILKSVDSFDE